MRVQTNNLPVELTTRQSESLAKSVASELSKDMSTCGNMEDHVLKEVVLENRQLDDDEEKSNGVESGCEAT